MPNPVAQSTTTATGTATPVSLNVNASIANGDLMVVFVGVAGSVPGNTPSVTPPAGWTLWNANFPTVVISGTSRWLVSCYYRIALNEPASYSWVFGNAGAMLLSSTRITGASSSPVDDGNGQTNAGTSAIAPSINGTNLDLLMELFFSATVGSTQTYTNPGTHQDVANLNVANISFSLDDENIAATGATGTRTSTLGTGNSNAGLAITVKAATNELSQNFWFSDWQYPRNNFQLASLRRFRVEEDDIAAQLFTQPSAPVGGWNTHEDYLPVNRALVLTQPTRQPWPDLPVFATFQIPQFQMTWDGGASQLPRRFLTTARYSDPATIFIQVQTPFDPGQLGMWNVSPQLPIPPRMRPREDGGARCVVVDIGDLLEKSWPAANQQPWAVPFRPLRGVRDLVQPFDTSWPVAGGQPLTMPPMMPWDGGAAALPRSLPNRRLYSDLAVKVLPVPSEEFPFFAGAWATQQPVPFRPPRPTLIQAPAASDSPFAFIAVDASVLMSWNAPAALPRWTRPLLAGDQSPIPKLPDANESILGAWQGQTSQRPIFPARSSALLAAAADPLRTWGLVPESMAWFSPWAERIDRPIILARRQTVEVVGPGNFMFGGEAPFFWLWDSGQQVPVRYPTSPARTFTTEALAGALLGLPTGLIIVAGPYFVFQGQIYVAGPVQGDLSSEVS